MSKTGIIHKLILIAILLVIQQEEHTYLVKIGTQLHHTHKKKKKEEHAYNLGGLTYSMT